MSADTNANEVERVRVNRRRLLEVEMHAAHVHPEIIARVLRLNPDPQDGVQLRGIHYTGWRNYTFSRLMPKGRFIRRYGREAFEQIPREALRKDGRRVYVSLQFCTDNGL